jgi:hypothetical protein
MVRDGLPKTNSLRYVSKELAKAGFVTDRGTAYLPQHVKDILLRGLTWSTLYVLGDEPGLEQGEEGFKKLRSRLEQMLRCKRSYCRSTDGDPYLNERLGWWRYRKVGKKPNGSRYERDRQGYAVSFGRKAVSTQTSGDEEWARLIERRLERKRTGATHIIGQRPS